MKLTIQQAKAAIPGDMTLNKKDGEFRVNFRGGSEETAYYTNDIEDAVCTAIDMSTRNNRLLQ